MIIIQDRIEVSSENLARLQQLILERYRPQAEQRGMVFVEIQVSPPLALRNAPCTLWLRWRVADAASWWGMRVQAFAHDVAGFWMEVDSLCEARERVYLTADSADQLPQPANVDEFLRETYGHRETAQLRLCDDVIAEARAAFEETLQAAGSALPGIIAAHLGENLAPDYAVGHFTWDLLFTDSESAGAARQSAVWREQVEPLLERCCSACHALGLDTLGAGVRNPRLRNGVKRTAYFRLLPGVDQQSAESFERDLLEMPAQIAEIRNWRLSRAVNLPWGNGQDAQWTYVWEQEFETLEGLTGPYMLHPHHWAHIDRWFDPESGAQAVDTHLSHAFCQLSESLITSESEPLACVS